MPTIPCPTKITCECIDNPFGNFTAEGPDVDRFLSVAYVFNPPPLNQFGVLGCKAWCWSPISQSEAELCAVTQATLCGNPPLNPPGLFGNVAQTCDYTCPTGGVSSYTVAANQVYESTQSAADALAFSIACIGAESNAHCIPTPQPPSGGSGPSATAWWKMEEAFGNRMDSVHGIALVPTVIGFGASVNQVAGKVGSGVSMTRANNTSAYLSSSGYSALGFNSNGQTLLGWCKVQYPVAGGLVMTFGYFSLHVDLLNNQVTILFDTQDLSNVSAPLTPDEWFFFAIYYDSVTGKLGANINGLTVAESADPSFPDFQPNGFVSFSSATNSVAASIDELAFYQTKLNAAQIAAIYNAGGGRTYPVTLPA